MDKMILILIIVFGSGIFLLSLCKNKLETVLTFVLRILMGFLGIYIGNQILGQMGIDVMVGINAVTMGAIGILGLPGYALLYAIEFFL